MIPKSLFLVHAAADAEFAREMGVFLEFGCNARCMAEDGRIQSPEEFLDRAEEGLTADVLVLVLSPSSSPVRWPRERWEPLLFQEARELGVEVVTVLLKECQFPALLRRQNFLDGTQQQVWAMRGLKRWLWRKERGDGKWLPPRSAPDLEQLYEGLADKRGTLRTSGLLAGKFAGEAEGEFDAVLWVPCHGRTLPQAAGELGALLGMTMAGTVEENCRAIRQVLEARRCLLILDAPGQNHRDALIPTEGRSSALITDDAVRVCQTPETLEYARWLFGESRFAEAYELLQRLQGGKRELIWICEQWDRLEEANSLRGAGETWTAPQQLALF